jgi:hypothetical protein
MPTGVVWALHVITKNDLRAWVIGVTPVAQEFCNVLNVLVTSMQFILAACVVDANEEGLLASSHD